METMIEAIRVAVCPDATDEQRTHGAVACRTILAALDAKPGEPIATPATAAAVVTPDLAPLVQAIRTMGPDQLLDIAIAKLRAALPEGTNVAPVGPPKFHIVPVAPLGGGS